MSEPAVVVRPARAGDMRAVGRLGAQLVRLHHEFDPQRFMAASAGTGHGYGSFLGTQLADPDVIVLVAEREGHVVGYTYAGNEGVDYMSLRDRDDAGTRARRRGLIG